jgi:hypothetical protein
MAFMRLYGMAGDPGRLTPRRKSAAAGPRIKAGRKRQVRAKRAARGGAGKGFDFGSLGMAALGSLPGGGIAQNIAGQVFHKGGKSAAGEEGSKRRRTNPTNVKALRRSLRRVEGFGHLVARVNKMLPKAHRYAVHPVLKHKRRRKSA